MSYSKSGHLFAGDFVAGKCATLEMLNVFPFSGTSI